MSSKTYTYEEISHAINQAANDVDSAFDLDEHRENDIINVLVGAAMHYLTGEAETLTDSVELNWDGELEIRDGELHTKDDEED